MFKKILSILALFTSREGTQAQTLQDPYWVFDQTKHLKPKISTSDFYRLKGFDFGWLLLKPLTEQIKDEIKQVDNLSYGQKALWFWWYVDGQVTNGGFTQFYYNEYGKYVPSAVKGLLHIGDEKMASLILRADEVYQEKKSIVEDARTQGLFGSNLYQQLSKMEDIDKEYFKIHELTMANIEKYVRLHSNEFCIDENGKEFKPSAKGEIKVWYPNGKLKEVFTLSEGKLTGDYQKYYENGNLQEKTTYENGEETEKKLLFYENGQRKLVTIPEPQANRVRKEHFYANGNPEKLEYTPLPKHGNESHKVGEYKAWYENGQLKIHRFFDNNYKSIGKVYEFYADGRHKEEAEFVGYEYLIHNFWNEKGELLLQNGTGLYIREYDTERTEQEYKDNKRHGIQKTFKNGILTLYQEMENGKEHGYTRVYYKNGKVKEEIIYKNGIQVSKKRFPISQNPVAKNTFKFSMKNEWLEDLSAPLVDTYPVCLNQTELEKIAKTPKTILDIEYHDYQASVTFFILVNEKGKAIDAKFNMAYLCNGEEVLDILNKMKFKPATKNGKNVTSYVYLIADFELE